MPANMPGEGAKMFAEAPERDPAELEPAEAAE